MPPRSTTDAARALVVLGLIGPCACLATAGLGLVLPIVSSVPLAHPLLQWLPWVAGILVLGLPHGALDHEVGDHLDGPWSRRRRLVFIALYLSAVLVGLLAWFVWPLGLIAAFLTVSAYHFGQGDVYWSRQIGLAGRRSDRGYRLALLACRSTVPILVPVLWHAESFGEAATTLGQRLFGGTSSWNPESGLFNLGWVLVTTASATQCLLAVWSFWSGPDTTRVWAFGEIAETIILWGLFLCVPPILAVGVYFNCWHSVRHVGRLLLLDEPPTRERPSNPSRGNEFDPAVVSILGRLGRFHVRTLPMTLASLVGLAVLIAVLWRTVEDPTDIGLILLALISALTFPHVMVVAWMDLRQDVWARGVRAGYGGR